MINFYEVLGISESATNKEVQKAYRTLAKTKHPDINKAENADEEFQKIVDAYDVLSDTALRKQYDEQRNVGFSNDFKFDKLFEKMAQARRTQYEGFPVKGQNIVDSLSVTISQIMRNETVVYSRNIERTCVTCNGKKIISSGDTCIGCGGSCYGKQIINTPFGKVKQKVPCEICLGTGKSNPKQCYQCEGKGKVTVKFEQEIHLNDFYFGEVILMEREGLDGINGGGRGDILVTVMQKPDPRYRVEYGNNIVNFTFVTLEEMLIGEDVSIEMPNGSYQKVSLSEHALNPQNKISFAGQGMMNEQGQRGTYTTSLIVDFSKIDANTRRKIVQLLKDVK